MIIQSMLSITTMMAQHTPVITMAITIMEIFLVARIQECHIHKLIIMKENHMNLEFNQKVIQDSNGCLVHSLNPQLVIMKFITYGKG